MWENGKERGKHLCFYKFGEGSSIIYQRFQSYENIVFMSYIMEKKFI